MGAKNRLSKRKGVTETELEKIYKAYFGAVYRYLLRLTGSKEDAEDLTGETFLRAQSANGRLRDEKALYAYLRATAYHLYADQMRRAGRLPIREEGYENCAVPAAEEAFLLLEKQRRLDAALETLPAPYGAVFRLRFEGGMDFAAIGKSFGRSANWACVTCHRAKQKLRLALTKGEHNGNEQE